MSCERLLFICTLTLGLATRGAALPVTYTVTVNTASVSGDTGSLDFNFNPGPLVTQAANLQILNFSTDGTPNGAPVLTGDVSGAIPSALTFDNGTTFNDYFQGFTYASVLSFNVSISGPAVTNPDGVSTSGSTFAFSMFSDPAGTIPALTSDTVEGFAYIVNINLDGTTTATSFLRTTNVPEPTSGSFALAGIFFSMAALAQIRKQKQIR